MPARRELDLVRDDREAGFELAVDAVHALHCFFAHHLDLCACDKNLLPSLFVSRPSYIPGTPIGQSYNNEPCHQPP